MTAATAHPGVLSGLRAIASHAGALSISQVIRRLFRMCVLLVTARILGVETFGGYVLILTVIEMVAVISGYGYMDYLTREIAQDPGSAWPLARRITALRYACILPSLGLGLLVLWALHFPSSLVMSAAWLGATLIPRAITESAQGMLKGIRRFAPLPWIELSQGIVVLGSATILLLQGFGVRGAVIAEILGALAAATISTIAVARRVDLKSSTGVLRPLSHSVFSFNIYPFLTSIYDRVDVVLLSKLAGNFATGIYSLPYRAFATLQIIPYGVMGALLPVFSKNGGKHDSAKICARSMKFLLIAALFLILLTLTFAGPAVHLFLGSSYADCVVTIYILIWAVIPAFMNFALNTLLIASGKEMVFLWTATACTAFNILANLLFIPRYSFLAAASITVLTECLLLILNSVCIYRSLGHVVHPADGLQIAAVFAVIFILCRILSHVIPAWLAGSLAAAAFLFFAFVSAGLRFPDSLAAVWGRTT